MEIKEENFKNKGKNEKRYYVYVDKRKITGSSKDFSKREFKKYIEDKGYIFGKRVYLKKRSSPVFHRAYAEIESDSLIKSNKYSGYRVRGYCDFEGTRYYGLSGVHPVGKYGKGRDMEAKQEVVNNISWQILAKKENLVKPSGDSEINAGNYKQFENISHEVAIDTVFYYVYLRE